MKKAVMLLAVGLTRDVGVAPAVLLRMRGASSR